MPNRLAGETSPYLLQHAHNPVDWYPWGPEAIDRARTLDRPIFLSIGYAACHWCHVMERESFEDEATARVLNERFVAVKVDREERPDLDSIYMGAVQAMTGQGGWPMSVFLTPDGAPFYGGTYFPDSPRHGMPSFHQVLDGVWQAWTTQRGEVQAAGQRLVSALVDQAATQAPATTPQLDAGFFAQVDEALATRFDPVNGSWGGAPKFPQPMTLEYLLRRIVVGERGSESALLMTLDRMADGGIHDQLGGGFHRYATDAKWLVPHFEQMLYDNAQLARVYLHAWSVLGRERDRATAVEVLDYVLRELTTDDGAFAASQDADTEGIEGLTFTWRAAEIREVLGDAAPAFTAAYGVTDDGNWEGVTILSRVTPRADALGEASLGGARARLLERRASRPQPARDDKALAAWNGLMIAALAEAGRLLGEERYTTAAVQAARTVCDGLLDPATGALRRSWKDGRAVGQGVLEDHAHLAEGLLALYETTGDERWFAIARALADRILERFEDPAGGFFDTADDHEQLITRPKDPQDNAVPSGAAMATTVLLRLAALTGEARYREAAERALGTVQPYLTRYPTGFAQWLVAATFAAAEVDEVAVVGALDDDATRSLIAPVWSTWRPNQVFAIAPASGAATSVVPLLHDRVAIEAARRRTSAATSPAACPSPMRRRLPSSSSVTEAVVEPRPAATVVLLRPGPTGLEALLTHRPTSMAFAADMHVFPGGRVDAADADPRLVARSSITPAEAAAALGGDLSPETAHAAYVAAIREAFEEVGVLLADAPADADLVAARDRLLAEPASFPDLVETLDLRLRTDALVPLSRWVTPPTLARRFDARFFAAAVPPDVEASLIGDEVAAHAWSTPRAALDAMAAGSIGMWLPTSATLQQLEHAGSLDDVRRHATPGPLTDTDGRGHRSRRDADHDAGRRRCRRAARACLPRRAAALRPRRPWRPDGSGARPRHRARRRPRRADRGRRAHPGRPRPCGRGRSPGRDARCAGPRVAGPCRRPAVRPRPPVRRRRDRPGRRPAARRRDARPDDRPPRLRGR